MDNAKSQVAGCCDLQMKTYGLICPDHSLEAAKKLA
jgi:hypothetical protein